MKTITSRPRKNGNLTPHQLEVEEAAGMPLDWGLQAAYMQGRKDAICDYADLSTSSTDVNQATPEYLKRLELIKNHKLMYYDFAREVIGWSFPSWQGDVLYHLVPDGITRDVFAPLQIENVLKWVQNWCGEHEQTFSINYKTYGDSCFTVEVASQGAESDDLNIALICACLAAERDRAQEHKVQP